MQHGAGFRALPIRRARVIQRYWPRLFSESIEFDLDIVLLAQLLQGQVDGVAGGQKIAIGFTIITFYETPDPVFGYSFSGLIVETMAKFAAILDASVVMLVVTTLDGILAKFVAPVSCS